MNDGLGWGWGYPKPVAPLLWRTCIARFLDGFVGGNTVMIRTKYGHRGPWKTPECQITQIKGGGEGL